MYSEVDCVPSNVQCSSLVLYCRRDIKQPCMGEVGEERAQLTKVGGSIARVRVPPACFAWFLTFPLGSVFSAESLSPYTTWISAVSDTDALLAEWDKGGIVTVDMGGRVRLWETGLERLQQSLVEWRNMIGQDSDRPLQVSFELTFLLTN